MTTIERLKALSEAATPGPWAWFHDRYETYLATVDRGRVFVMGFARRGMNGAQPTFQVRDADGNGYMKTAAEIGDLRVHPDADLIVAAVNALPALLAVVEAAEVICDPMVADGGGDRWWDAHTALTTALAALDAQEEATT